MAEYNEETFKRLLSQFVGFDKSDSSTEKILNEFWNAYNAEGGFKTQPVSLGDIPMLLIGTGKAPEFDKKYSTFIEMRKQADKYSDITSLLDFNQARIQYKNILKSYNLKDLATNENVDKFLLGNVSAEEASYRLNAAYDAVVNADSVLKNELAKFNLTDNDLARTLLLGKDGAIELKNKIATANVMAAQQEAGLTSAIGAEELAKRGITRDAARQGLSQVKEMLPGTAAAATRAGISTQDLQKELESESVLGMASQRRRKAQQAESARFGGRAGITNTSLGKSSAGSF